MKKYLPIILMVWPYLFALFFMLPDRLGENIYIALLPAYLILTILVYILNILNAFHYRGNEAALKLAFNDMIIKLIHIPFYLCIFVIGALSIMVMVVPAFLFISPMIVMVLFLVDCFLMLTSSMYGISAAIKSSKEGVISKKSALSHIIFHCIFVTDVISAVILYRKIKSSINSSQTAN